MSKLGNAFFSFRNFSRLLLVWDVESSSPFSSKPVGYITSRTNYALDSSRCIFTRIWNRRSFDRLTFFNTSPGTISNICSCASSSYHYHAFILASTNCMEWFYGTDLRRSIHHKKCIDCSDSYRYFSSSSF